MLLFCFLFERSGPIASLAAVLTGCESISHVESIIERLLSFPRWLRSNLCNGLWSGGATSIRGNGDWMTDVHCWTLLLGPPSRGKEKQINCHYMHFILRFWGFENIRNVKTCKKKDVIKKSILKALFFICVYRQCGHRNQHCITTVSFSFRSDFLKNILVWRSH